MADATPRYEPLGTWFVDENDALVAIVEGELLALPAGTSISLRGDPSRNARVTDCKFFLDHGADPLDPGKAWLLVRVATNEPVTSQAPRTLAEFLRRTDPS
jgi:hypothetical protein